MRFLAVLIWAAVCFCQASEPLSGRWEGAAQVPGMEVRMVIDLATDQQGNWTGSAILPGFDIKGAPLAGITVQDAHVTFEIKGAFGGTKLDGRLAAGQSLAGTFEQGGNKAPFTLRKTGVAQVDPPRRSTPVGAEVAGEWRGELEGPGGNKLRARLTLANQPGGTAKAEFVVTGKRENKLPVDLVIQDGEWLTVECPDFGITYEGRLRAGSQEITGEFRQGGFESPLVFRRVAAGTDSR